MSNAASTPEEKTSGGARVSFAINVASGFFPMERPMKRKTND